MAVGTVCLPVCLSVCLSVCMSARALAAPAWGGCTARIRCAGRPSADLAILGQNVKKYYKSFSSANKPCGSSELARPETSIWHYKNSSRRAHGSPDTMITDVPRSGRSECVPSFQRFSDSFREVGTCINSEKHMKSTRNHGSQEFRPHTNHTRKSMFSTPPVREHDFQES